MSRKKRSYNFDPIATEAKRFLDPKSFVNWKGKIFLGKKDWEITRMKVYDRDEGRCQICKEMVWFDDFDADHYPKSRGKGGDDSMGNLRTTHHRCHMGTHLQVRSGKGT